MGEEKETRLHYGTVNFEKRKYPRFYVDLPVEYARSGSVGTVAKPLMLLKGDC
jgi:hypothetical protein